MPPVFAGIKMSVECKRHGWKGVLRVAGQTCCLGSFGTLFIMEAEKLREERAAGTRQLADAVTILSPAIPSKSEAL